MKRLLIVAALVLPLAGSVQGDGVYPDSGSAEAVTPEPLVFPLDCPCFSQADIDAVLVCAGSVVPTCQAPPTDPVYLLLACDPGGAVPPSILGIYLAYDADPAQSNQPSCYRDDINGEVPPSPPPALVITAQQANDCQQVIVDSGFCI